MSFRSRTGVGMWANIASMTVTPVPVFAAKFPP